MSFPVTEAVHVAASVAGAEAVSFDLVSMWNAMGIMAKLAAVILGAMSAYSLSVMAERLFAHARASHASREFARELVGLLPAGKFNQAILLAKRYQRGHLARIMGHALTEYQKPCKST